MAIQARCPQCASNIRAGEKYAGKQVKCPKCGGAIQVPAAGHAAAAPVAAEPVAAEPKAPPLEEAHAAAADATTTMPDANEPADVLADAAAVVRIGDEAEHWRKSVSKNKSAAKKQPARQESEGKPPWLWPAVGAGAAAVILAIGAGIWMQQPESVAADADSPAPDALARNAPVSDEPAITPDEPAASADPAQNETMLAARRDEQPVPQTEPIKSDAAPANPTGENLAAIPSRPIPSDETVEPAEDANPEMEAKPDAAATPAPAVAATEPKSPPASNRPPEEVLEEHGLRIVGDQVALIDESVAQLRTQIRDANKLRLNLGKTFTETMKIERLQKNLKAEFGARNVALAQAAASGDVAVNNVLVGQLNAIQAKMEQVDDALEKSRQSLAEVREEYIEHLLKTREIVDSVEQHYEELAANPEVQSAVARLPKDGDTELALVPTGSFARTQRDLESLEEQILTDTIAARVEAGNLHVSTMINGEHSLEMLVDSGASLVTLPYAMAVTVGLKPKATDPVIQLQIADGSLISGQLITIPSLRVGKFTVEDVEAAVLGPEAVNATPLLGMSFLGKFEAKIDSNRGKLILSHIEGTEGSEKIR